jgi:hypothetical protein
MNRLISDEARARELVPLAAVVIGANGKGGSGVCVQLEDGAIAVLTAKHVVLECLRNTGRVRIAAYNVKSQDPELIRMDSTQQGDSAYLMFKEPPTTVKAVPYPDWTTSRLDLEVGQRVITVGFPSFLRKREGNMLIPRIAWLGDSIVAIQGNHIVSGINEIIEGMPNTLEGFSGAGLFSDDGRFIGVVVEEKRRLTESFGELYSLLPSGYAGLYTPFSAPPGRYHNDQRALRITLLRRDGTGIQAIVGVLAQCIWSRTDPAERYGRLFSLEFVIPGINEHYPININSEFTWTGNAEADRIRAMEEEFRFLLLRMRWLLKDELDGGSTVQIHPLT